MKPVVLTAAINGAEVTRAQHPALPLLPEEVAQEVLRCEAEGASVVHLHGRLPNGRPTQDLDTFRSYFEAIRAVSAIIVQFSTGGAVGMGVEERIEALCLMPEMATLTTGTCNFGDDVFANPRPVIREIAGRLRQFDVRPEIEVFEKGMLDEAMALVAEGVLKGPQHVNFVLGVPGAMRAEPSPLAWLVESVPSGWTWSVAGVGRHELPLAAEAIALGGHVRVGVEDNLYLERGVPAPGSWALVGAAARLAEEAGRPVASIEEAREILRVREVRHPCG